MNRPYRAAMKLAEVTMGRELMGFHPLSRFRQDGTDPNSPANTYNYRDNQALIELGVPGDPKAVHPLAAPSGSI